MPIVLPPRHIEVETSSYCNRTCGWCPNGHTTARTKQKLMDWGLFEKITDELAERSFEGYFAFHNYNEPLFNERLYPEIARLQAVLPHAKPAIYTNGDLLRAGTLTELLELGVRYVRVTRYPQKETTEPTREALEKYLKQTGLAEGWTWKIRPVRQGLSALCTSAETGVHIEVIRPAIATYNSRNGAALVPTIPAPRTAPCLMTATSATIDYRGNLRMCCNIYPDAPDAADYVVGNLAEAGFWDLWSGPVMADWRARQAVADWSTSPACRFCTQALPETRQENGFAGVAG